MTISNSRTVPVATLVSAGDASRSAAAPDTLPPAGPATEALSSQPRAASQPTPPGKLLNKSSGKSRRVVRDDDATEAEAQPGDEPADLPSLDDGPRLPAQFQAQLNSATVAGAGQDVWVAEVAVESAGLARTGLESAAIATASTSLSPAGSAFLFGWTAALGATLTQQDNAATPNAGDGSVSAGDDKQPPEDAGNKDDDAATDSELHPPVEPPEEPPADTPDTPDTPTPDTPTQDTTGPVFTSATSFDVAENATEVATLAATDDSGPVQYELDGTDGDNSKFRLTSAGVLTFLAAPDFETPASAAGSNVYNVKVKAIDALGNASTQTLTVNVTDVNEVPPDTTGPFFTSATSFDVAENATEVTALAATDASGPVQYELDGTDGDNSKFRLTSAGVLTFLAAPDFETPASAAGSNVYSVKVKAIDALGNASTQTLTINVTDVNEVPPDTAGPVFTNGTSFDVAENATEVTALAATDASGPVRYELDGSSGDNGKFSLSADGVLTFLAAPDFETPASAAGSNVYNVKVKAIDALGNASTQTLTVNVTDVNEVPPDTTGPVFTSATSFDVAENATEVTALAATDASGPVRYELDGSSGDNGKFSLSADGVLTFLAAPDFETPASAAGSNVYSVKVKAIDALGNASTQTLTVNVTDVNEVPPDTAGPVFTNATSFDVAENATEVATLAATDASGPVRYELDGTDGDNSKFRLTSAGVLTFLAAPDFETPASAARSNVYSVKVKAIDALGNASTQTLTINVTDVNEVPPDTTGPVFTNATSFDVAENATEVATLAATDDSGPVQYELDGTDGDNSKFRLTSAGVLTFLAAPDFETPASAAGSNVYSVKVKAIDAQGNASTQTLTINVTDVDEGTPDPALTVLPDWITSPTYVAKTTTPATLTDPGTAEQGMATLLANDGMQASWLPRVGGVRPAGSTLNGAPVALSYAFQGAGVSFSNTDRATVTTTEVYSDIEKDFVRSVFASFASFANLVFTESTSQATVGAGGADLRMFKGTAEQLGVPKDVMGYAVQPMNSRSVDDDGNFFLTVDAHAYPADGTAFTTDFGNEKTTVAHELAHALGLDHPFAESELQGKYWFGDTTSTANRVGASTGGGYDTPRTDAPQETLMTYLQPFNAVGGNWAMIGSTPIITKREVITPYTAGVYDIAALQHLYGANMSHNLGNTVYAYNSHKAVFDTIWDAGGASDTLQQIGNVGAIIDLRGGEHMSRMGIFGGAAYTFSESVMETAKFDSMQALFASAGAPGYLSNLGIVGLNLTSFKAFANDRETGVWQQNGTDWTWISDPSIPSDAEVLFRASFQGIDADGAVVATTDPNIAGLTQSTLVGRLTDVGVPDASMAYNVGIAFGVVIENAIGGDGNDIIWGNAAANTITTGAGDDVIKYASAADIHGDVLTDFGLSGADKIDLSAWLSSMAGVSADTAASKLQWDSTSQLLSYVDSSTLWSLTVKNSAFDKATQVVWA